MERISLLVIGALILAFGMYIGARLKEAAISDDLKTDLVWEASDDVKVYVSTLEYMQRNELDKAIEVLEENLTMREGFLSACDQVNCGAAVTSRVESAKKTLSDYRRKHQE